MPNIIAVLLFFVSLMATAPLAAQPKDAQPKGDGANGDHVEITLPGKAICSAKNAVTMKHAGIITYVNAKVGQPIKLGDVLVKYTLKEEETYAIREKLMKSRTNELKVRLQETELRLVTARSQVRSAKQLFEKDLGPEQTLKDLEGQIQKLSKIREEIIDALKRANQLAEENLKILRKTMGPTLTMDHIPEAIELTSPQDGHVVWVNDDLGVGNEFAINTVLLYAGTMETMFFRVDVFESEAMKMAVGDKAKFYPQSFPGQVFEAVINRISWLPSTASADVGQPTFYKAEFLVMNPKLLLKEGMMGQIVFRIPK